MSIRRHIGLIVTLSVCSVLCLILVILLFQFRSRYLEVRNGLRSAEQRLKTLNERAPHPSEANVQMVQSNLVLLSSFYKSTIQTLKLGQIDPEDIEPAAFPPILDRTIKRLYERSREFGVKLPPRFAFGFERYVLGALPNREDVARLNMQLRTIEKLCDTIMKCKVAELTEVQRTIFEKGVAEAAETGRRRRFAVEQEAEQAVPEWVDPSGLFSRETYTFKVVAPDSVLLNVLNELARIGTFVVVSAVTVEGEVPAVKAVTPAPVVGSQESPKTTGEWAPLAPSPTPSAAEKKEPPPHEERVVAGTAMVKATIEVRVYRFLEKVASEENPT